MKLNEEQRGLVEDNLNLARYMANKWSNKCTIEYPYNYDEIFSMFSYALCKAGITFNPDKGTKFSTYAVKCMENEIKMALRRKNVSRELKEYLNESISDSKHLEYDNVLDIIAIRGVLNSLNQRQRDIFTYAIYYELKQERIAELIGISRSYVSRLEKRTIDKLAELKLGVK